MLLLMFMTFIIMMLLIFMLLINFFISKKMIKNREKMSPFECGFDPIGINRIPFSLQFFLIGIIFLIFDIEIAFIFPMVKSFMLKNFLISINFFIIIMILLLGLFLEWKEGALKWFK